MRGLFRRLATPGIAAILRRPRLAMRGRLLVSRFPAIETRLKSLVQSARDLEPPALAATPFTWLAAEPRGVRTAFARVEACFRNPPTSGFRLAAKAKPTLALVTPLPPDETGIADYSAALVPALARYYEIDVVCTHTAVPDVDVTRHANVRSIAWFERNAVTFDRIVYQVGNSAFHAHMFRLLEAYPGIVVLHDFFLGHIMAHLELHGGWHNYWTTELLLAHGYPAAFERWTEGGIPAAILKYAVNLSQAQHSLGVIVHSKHALELAKGLYGADGQRKFTVVPQLRAVVSATAKDQARAALGLPTDAFVVCSFGYIAETKLHHRILRAWALASLPSDCLLVFVGATASPFGDRLRDEIARLGFDTITITGRLDSDRYDAFLAAADCAIQLRGNSRGETSRAVLDCLAYGLATIVNAHGSLAELPPDTTLVLPDLFGDGELADAIKLLHRDAALRRRIGAAGRAFVAGALSPEKVAARYFGAIEDLSSRGGSGFAPTADRLARIVGGSTHAAPLGPDRLLELARDIAAETPACPRRPQLLIDVSAIARGDLRTGIQRVVRSQVRSLIENPPEGYRVEPVRLSREEGRDVYRYARNYTFSLHGLGQVRLEDEPVDFGSADVLLLSDYSPTDVSAAIASGIYRRMQSVGVSINAMIYDLLPVLRPEFFPVGADVQHREWLTGLAGLCDRLVCISESVAADVRQWLRGSVGDLRTALQVATVPLGADFEAVSPQRGPDLPLAAMMNVRGGRRPAFLMVGTIEPRKGYLQAIAAFDRLWQQGTDVALIIVGERGWKHLPDAASRTIPDIVERLARHPESGKRLLWLQGVDDQALSALYQGATCLLMASQGEGLGLPLIEAASHGLPILARDLPVFREVTGHNASYFAGDDAEALARSVAAWLDSWQAGRHITSAGLRPTTWTQHVQALQDVLFGGETPVSKTAILS